MTKKILIAIIVMVTIILFGIAVTRKANADPVEKITICHASGLAGTTKFETLNLPHPAVYGNGGHFNEDGTPKAGHEDDYLGECKDVVTPTPTLEVSPTATPSATPTVVPTDTSTPTPTPNTSKEGDGRSDGKSSCPECTKAPEQRGQVLQPCTPTTCGWK